MSTKQNKCSICKVMNGKKLVGYLSNRDIENGMDSRLDMLGYTIIAL